MDRIKEAGTGSQQERHSSAEEGVLFLSQGLWMGLGSSFLHFLQARNICYSDSDLPFTVSVLKQGIWLLLPQVQQRRQELEQALGIRNT